MKLYSFLRVAAACALTLPLAAIGSISASAAVDAESVKKSVVWVDTHYTGTVHVPLADKTTQNYPAAYLGKCSGWIASGSGHVVTAGHCVLPGSIPRIGLIADAIAQYNLVGANNATIDHMNVDWQVTFDPSPRVRIGQPAIIKDRLFDTDMTAQVLDSQPPDSGDNAVVQVTNFDTSSAVLPLSATTPKVLDRVTSVGYPGDTANLTEVDRQEPSFKSGEISALVQYQNGTPGLQLNGGLVGGMSGGPTLNESGEVVGVNSARSLQDSTQSWVTDTNSLRTFLSKNAVPLTAAQPPSAIASQATAPSPGAAANQAVAPDPSVTAQPQPDESDNSSAALGFLILTLLAFLIIAVAILGFMVIKSRRAKPTNTP